MDGAEEIGVKENDSEMDASDARIMSDALAAKISEEVGIGSEVGSSESVVMTEVETSEVTGIVEVGTSEAMGASVGALEADAVGICSEVFGKVKSDELTSE